MANAAQDLGQHVFHSMHPSLHVRTQFRAAKQSLLKLRAACEERALLGKEGFNLVVLPLHPLDFLTQSCHAPVHALVANRIQHMVFVGAFRPSRMYSGGV